MPPSWKHFYLPSKAAILIIFSAAAVGSVYYAVLGLTVVFIDSKPQSSSISISVNDGIPYAILAFVMIFYPLSGFIADVCCGRLKTVAVSLCLLLTFVLLTCLVGITIALTMKPSQDYLDPSFLFHNQGIFLCIIALASFVFFITGLVGYQANFVQFGLGSTLWSAQSLSGPLCTLCYVGFPFRICPNDNRSFAFVWSSKKNST